MKLFFPLTILLLIILSPSCANKKERGAGALLENDKDRNEIIDTLLSNPAYLSEFLDRVMSNERARIALIGNRRMMKTLCMSDKMDSLIATDPQVMEHINNNMIKKMVSDSFVCDKTCTSLLENEGLKKFIQSRINQQASSKTPHKINGQ